MRAWLLFLVVFTYNLNEKAFANAPLDQSVGPASDEEVSTVFRDMT